MPKRVFDLVTSLIALTLLAPVFVALILLIRRDGGPAFFKQVRVGKGGRLFKVYKFRSMVVNAEELGEQVTMRHDPRITVIGRALRKAKLDELPQLFNVLMGDMSIVGPRPEVPYYVERWSDEERQIVLSVKPGITDYATLFYHDEQGVLVGAENPEKTYLQEVMPHKLKMYRRYVRERSFRVDLRLILATLRTILTGCLIPF